MISIFRKQIPTNITLELKKNFILDSAVDDTKNQLLFPGNISVTINGLPEGVESVWELTNTNTNQFVGSFTGSQTVERLDVGEYEVLFDDVSEYITPETQKRILSERQTLSILGNYVRNSGDFNIIIDSNLRNFDKELAFWTISGIDVDYLKPGNGDLLVNDLELGTYNIVFDPVPEFRTPDIIPMTIEANKTKDVLGLYVIECSSTSTTGSFSGTNIVITTPAILPDAHITEFYAVQLSVEGGIAPYAWSTNDLPNGLELLPSGLITGTPTELTFPIAQYKPVEVRVIDNVNEIEIKTFKIRVFRLA